MKQWKDQPVLVHRDDIKELYDEITRLRKVVQIEREGNIELQKALTRAASKAVEAIEHFDDDRRVRQCLSDISSNAKRGNSGKNHSN